MPDSKPPARDPNPDSVAVDCLEQECREFRGAARAVVAAIPPTHRSARRCASMLGISASLANFLLRASRSADVSALIATLPGEAGMRKLVPGLGRTGVSPTLIERFVSSAKRIRCLLLDQNLSRSTLRVFAAGGLDSPRFHAAMRRSRRQLFEAGMTVWGVSSVSRSTIWVIAPAATPGRVDLASVTMYGGLQRHRPGLRWRLLEARSRYLVPDATTPRPIQPLGRPTANDPFLKELSSPGVLGAELLEEAGIDPIGRNQPWFCFDGHGQRRDTVLAFGEVIRDLGGIYGDEAGDSATLRIGGSLPSETAVVDLLIHRSIPLGSDPTLSMYPTLRPLDVHRAPGTLDQARLPLEAGMELVPSGWSRSPERLSHPHPLVRTQYNQVIRRATAALGTRIGSFHRWRCVVSHPPAPSTMLVQWELARHETAALMVDS